jgi:hypothetical protein
MSPGMHTERAFEDAVYELVQEQGWHPGAANWRPELGIDTGTLLQFVGATQQQAWDDLIQRYGDQDTAQRQFYQRVASEIDNRGVLDVLRQGVKDRGVQIELAYFRPGHTLAADAMKEYRLNTSPRSTRTSPLTWRYSSTACPWRRWSSRTRTPGRAPTTPSRSTGPAMSTTSSSPSGPWCTSPSTRTGRSWRRG